MGYVGLPLAVAFAAEGHDVVAVDIDRRKVDALRDGRSYIEDVGDDVLAAVAPRIEATTHFADLVRCDAILICVPTPLTANREPDLGASPSHPSALAREWLGWKPETSFEAMVEEMVRADLAALAAAPGRDRGLALRARTPVRSRRL